MKKTGFTLVELLVAIAIMAILASVGFSTFSGSQKSARDAKRKVDIDNIAKAYEASYKKGAGYRPLKTEDFTKNTLPSPPKTGDYTGCVSNVGQPAFKVCAKLEDGSTDYCRSSVYPSKAPLPAPDTCSTLYAQEIAPPAEEPPAPPAPATIPNTGLVGYWKMDELSWGVTGGGDWDFNKIKDSSGKGNHISQLNGLVPGSGKFGRAGVFNPTTNSAASLGNDTDFNETGGLTFAAWIYINAYTEVWPTLYNKNNQTNSSGFIWIYQANNGSINYQYTTGSDVKTHNLNCGLETGKWQYLAVVHNRDTKTISCFVGSEAVKVLEKASITYTDTALTVTSGQAYFGAYQGRDNDTDHFNGRMDEVRLYNKPLTASEIESIYNFTPEPVGYWNFNEGSGRSILDSSGKGNNGTWYGNGAHWTAGKYGFAGQFNGSGDYISIPDSTSLNPLSFTLEAWVKPTEYVTADWADWIINKGSNEWADGFYGLALSSDNRYIFGSLNIGSNQANSYLSQGTVELAKWQHIAVTYDNNILKMYKDGDLVPGSPMTINKNRTINTSALIFGRRGDNTGSGYYYKGLLDEVKLYDYVRSDAQIQADSK